jgi:hypothetical protein
LSAGLSNLILQRQKDYVQSPYAMSQTLKVNLLFQSCNMSAKGHTSMPIWTTILQIHSALPSMTTRLVSRCRRNIMKQCVIYRLSEGTSLSAVGYEIVSRV